MATYLMSWDPTRWDWRNLKEQADQVARGTPVVRQWSCGSNRRIFSGDIVYFIRQGREPRGLFARAEVVRGSYEASNVSVQDALRGRNTLVVDVRFTELENASSRVLIPRQSLSAVPFGAFRWDIKESGVRIPDEVAEVLEATWQRLRSRGDGFGQAAEPVDLPAPEGMEEQIVQEREARLARPAPVAQQRAEPAPARSAAPVRQAAPDPARQREILVQNYFIMLDAEIQGALYSKADHRNRLLKELGVADVDALDRSHRHISAVLAEMGLPFVDSFPPEGGYAAELEKAVRAFIEGNPEFVDSLWVEELPPPASIPVELDDSRAHWVPAPDISGFKPSARPSWHPEGVNEIDFRIREARNRSLAMAGERFVLAFERARLRETGQKELQERIRWQSQTYGESFGYDILSVDPDGGDRYICVKTTNYGSRFPFTLSLHELERARENPDRFHIYRVFRFAHGAKLFMVSAREIPDRLQPVAFRAWF